MFGLKANKSLIVPLGHMKTSFVEKMRSLIESGLLGARVDSILALGSPNCHPAELAEGGGLNGH